MREQLAVWVLDQPGVLWRILSLFSRRGYNIGSLTAGPSEEAGVARVTITLSVDDVTAEQVSKQLYKLVDVIKVQVITELPTVERELLLVKVTASAAVRSELAILTEPFRAAVVDVGRTSLIVQATGSREKNDALLDLLKPYGITEVARTGVAAMVRSQTVPLKASALS